MGGVWPKKRGGGGGGGGGRMSSPAEGGGGGGGEKSKGRLADKQLRFCVVFTLVPPVSTWLTTTGSVQGDPPKMFKMAKERILDCVNHASFQPVACLVFNFPATERQ